MSTCLPIQLWKAQRVIANCEKISFQNKKTLISKSIIIQTMLLRMPLLFLHRQLVTWNFAFSPFDLPNSFNPSLTIYIFGYQIYWTQHMLSFRNNKFAHLITEINLQSTRLRANKHFLPVNANYKFKSEKKVSPSFSFYDRTCPFLGCNKFQNFLLHWFRLYY